MNSSTSPVDIRPDHLEIVQDILREHLPAGFQVWVFGSRTKWTTTDASDLDLAVEGPDALDYKAMVRLEVAFEESDLPYTVDVVDLNAITDPFKKIVEGQRVPLPTADGQAAVNSGRCQVRLGEIADINHSTYSLKEAWPFVNYLDTGNITENRITEIQRLVAGTDKIPSRARRKVEAGDIVYSTVRPNQRHFGRIRSVPDNFLASTAFAVIRGKEDVASTEFIYWSLAQDHIVEYLHSIAENSTSAYPSIKPGDLEQLTLSLPTLPEQRAIAHILGALDDKIELNRRMNETLEAMARAIFQDWFVYFGPVRAKLEGREPYLPPELWNLFPDRLVGSELGEVPEGWEVMALADCLDVARGLSYKGAGLSFYGMPMHNLNSIYEGGGYKDDGIKFYNGNFQERHVAQPGDVLVANTEQGHDRLLIGFAAIVPQRFGDNGLFSHHIYRVRPKGSCPLSPDFVCQLLNTKAMHDTVSGYATGTTVNMLPVDALVIPPVAVPPTQLVNAFTLVAEVTCMRQELLVAESNHLSAQRNALLPKLVSGELEIEELRDALEQQHE